MLERSGLRLWGADLVVWSDVPIGAGLSSSAALEVSVAHALLTQNDLPFDPVTIAQICQWAENDFVGARCGIMDQFGITMAKAAHALLVHTSDLHQELIPMNRGTLKDCRIVVCNSGVSHSIAAR